MSEKTSTQEKTTQDKTQATGGKKSSSNTLLIIIIVLVVLFGAGFLGLRFISGKISEKVGEKSAEKLIEGLSGGNVDIDKNGEDVTIKTKDGTISSSNELPSNFPKDFPIYDNAKVSGSLSTSNNDDNGSYVTFETSDSASKVTSFYKTELPAQGWSVESESTFGELTTLSTKKGTQEAVITISRDSDNAKTIIGVTVTNK